MLICLIVEGKPIRLVCEGQPRAGDVMRLPGDLFEEPRSGLIYGAPPAPEPDREVVISDLQTVWVAGDDGALVPTYEAHFKR